jgi:hypothetical protein
MKRINSFNKFVLILFSFVFVSCNTKNISLSDFSFLQGKWSVSADSLEYFEEWLPANDLVMQGKGGELRGRDTVFFETIKIEQRGTDFFYIVTGIDNDLPVYFKFTGFKNDSIVFENPRHDFPQRIIYFRLSVNSIFACIDGLDAGKYSRIEFPYQKSK